MYPIKMRGAKPKSSKTQQKRNCKNAIPQGLLNTIRVSVTVRTIDVVLALGFFFHSRASVEVDWSKFFTFALQL